MIEADNKIEVFLNKRERSSTVQHRRQSHRPQSALCDCGSHGPKCCRASCRPSHARQRCGRDSRLCWQPCAPRSVADGDFFALARFLHWHLNLIATLVRLHAEITSIDSHIDGCIPVQLRRACLFQHGVIMVRAAQCPTEKNDTRVRESHDGVLQQRPLFFPRYYSCCLAAS